MTEPDTAWKENDDDDSVIWASYEASARHFCGRNSVSGAAETLSQDKVQGNSSHLGAQFPVSVSTWSPKSSQTSASAHRR